MNTDRMSFMELQYMTLRREIEVSKANMFRLIVGGAAVIPVAQSVAATYSIGAITLALPFVVVVLVLLFLAENRSVMRAGTFILHQIEPLSAEVPGWETWLSNGRDEMSSRIVDKLLVFAFSVLAACYFMVSVVLAVRYAVVEFGERGQYLIGGAYIGIGVVLVFVLYSQAQTSTRRKN